MTKRDEHERKVRRFYDALWNRGDMDAADEILDAAFRFILTFLTVEDREAMKALVKYNRGVFEGLTYTCEPGDVVVDGDSAAAYWTMKARHVREWRKVPASHAAVSIQGMSFFRFSADGSIREVRVHNDVLGLMHQIGGVRMIYEWPSGSGGVRPHGFGAAACRRALARSARARGRSWIYSGTNVPTDGSARRRWRRAGDTMSAGTPPNLRSAACRIRQMPTTRSRSGSSMRSGTRVTSACWTR